MHCETHSKSWPVLADPDPHAGGYLRAAFNIRLKPTAEIKQLGDSCLRNRTVLHIVHRCLHIQIF